MNINRNIAIYKYQIVWALAKNRKCFLDQTQNQKIAIFANKNFWAFRPEWQFLQ